jgi:hypothetical protein
LKNRRLDLVAISVISAALAFAGCAPMESTFSKIGATKMVMLEDPGIEPVDPEDTPSGVSGSSGVSGVSGDSGMSGSSGVSGVSGDSGMSGSSGVSGVSGDSGMSGSSGVSGVSGDSGMSGVSGSSGKNDPPGHNKPPGNDNPPVVDVDPPSTPVECVDGQTLSRGSFKCHMSSKGADKIHCNIRFDYGDGRGRRGDTVTAQYLPSGSGGDLCQAVQGGSVIAKIHNVPEDCGQIHFSGDLDACVSISTRRNREQRNQMKLLVQAALLKELAGPNGASKVRNGEVRKGNRYFPLAEMGDEPEAPNYCIKAR